MLDELFELAIVALVPFSSGSAAPVAVHEPNAVLGARGLVSVHGFNL